MLGGQAVSASVVVDTTGWNDDALFLGFAPRLSNRAHANSASVVVVGAVSWDFNAVFALAPEPAGHDRQTVTTGVVELAARWDFCASVGVVAGGEAIWAGDNTSFEGVVWQESGEASQALHPGRENVGWLVDDAVRNHWQALFEIIRWDVSDLAQ